MYAVKILNEEGSFDYVTIGDSIKLFGSFEEAQKEIEELESWEEKIFGDITCRYAIEVQYGEKATG